MLHGRNHVSAQWTEAALWGFRASGLSPCQGQTVPSESGPDSGHGAATLGPPLSGGLESHSGF